MSVKNKIVFAADKTGTNITSPYVAETTTGINFEEDQQDIIKNTGGVQSLADQVERLEAMQKQLEIQEEAIKEKKKQIQYISGEVIPTMMSDMGLAELKLHDGSHLKVSTSYRATITEANKEAAFNWLRNNGLGDIIKNEISVSFGSNEDTRAADYANLAKSQGLQPTRKMKVESMTLKALVRERIEANKEMPADIFSIYAENKTTIKRSK